MTDLSARISRAAPASTDVAAFFSSARVQNPGTTTDRLSRGLSALGHIAGLAAPSDAQLQKVKESRPDVSVPLAQRIQPDLPQRSLWSTTTPVHHSKADMGDTGASASLLARLGPIPRATPPRSLLASIPSSSLPERPPRAREYDEEWADYNERRQDYLPSGSVHRSPPEAAQAATSTSLSHLLSSRSPRPATPPPQQALPAQDFRPPSPDYPPPDDEGVLPSIASSANLHSPPARSPVSDGQSRESAGAFDPADSAATVASYDPVEAQPLKRKASNGLIPSKSASPSKKPALATLPNRKYPEDSDVGTQPHTADRAHTTDVVTSYSTGNPTPPSPGHEPLDTSPIHAQHVFLPPADMVEQPGEPLSSLALDAPTSPTTLPLILRLSTPELVHEMPSVILDAEPNVDMFHNPISTSFPSPSDQEHTPPNGLSSPPINSSDNSEGGIHENPTTAGTILVPRAKLPDNLWSDDVASRTAARLRVREELVSGCRSNNRRVERVSWSDEGMSYSWTLSAEPEASEAAETPMGFSEQAGATDTSPDDREAALFLEAQAFLDNMRMKETLSGRTAHALAVSASDKSEGKASSRIGDSSGPSPASPANSSPRLSPRDAVVGGRNDRTFIIEISLPVAFQTSHDRSGPKYMAWQKSQIEAAQMRDERGARTCWVQPKKLRDGVFRLLWVPPKTMSVPVSPIPGAKLAYITPPSQADTGASDSHSIIPLPQSSRESSNPAELTGTAPSSTLAPGRDHAHIASEALPETSDKQNTSTLAISLEQDTDATNSYTVPLPAKWADIPTAVIKADTEFAPWLAAQRALLRTQLGAQHGSAPVSIRSLRAQGQIIFRWTVDQSEAHQEADPIPPTPLASDAAEPKGDMDGADVPAAPRTSSTSGQSSVILDITHPQRAERPASNEGNKQPIDITLTNNHQVPAESTTTDRELPATQSQSESSPQPQSPMAALSESTFIPETTSITSGSTSTSSGATFATDASQAGRVQDLRQSMDAKLRDLENWLKIQDSHPHRKPLLDKLIDKAQNEVLQLQQEIDFESARASD